MKRDFGVARRSIGSRQLIMPCMLESLEDYFLTSDYAAQVFL